MDQQTQSEPLKIHWISTTDSTEFTHFARVLTRSSVIGLDAEWKPVRGPTSSFPTVSILQLACQLKDKEEEIEVFLLDLSTLHLPSIWKLLTDMFVSPDILKLGFRFKQDLVYLDSTFVAHGCDPGFNQVYPYMDIVDIHHHLQHKNKQVVGRKMLKEIKSLAAICKDVLGISLSKELQCSDWSDRPLTEEQKIYAAIDAECLIRIFKVFFHANATKEGKSSTNMIIQSSIVNRGLKEILERHDNGYELKTIKSVEALDIIQATFSCEQSLRLANVHGMVPKTSLRSTMPMDESLSRIVREFGKKILLVGSDRKPKATKKKGKKKPSSALICKVKLDIDGDWQGPPPWDVSFGGDGCPKFLCDVMVEGLAKHLRCVGIDAAIPYSKKPGARELIDQAYKEHRVLLTRDAKLLKHQYTINNQVYRVKNLLKNEQLTEVIETFQLKISENQLMSRCTKCNGRFIQKPLSTEEAVEAAKGFQKIPSCLFDKNLEFWQCRDCKQLYWEGTQYHNAVQKFIDVCKLN